MGSLAALKQTYPQIEIIAHELDSPYIEGKSKPLRVVQAESNFDELPDEEKAGIEQFIAFLQSVEPTSVDVMVSSGEHLPWCDGIEIVHTPGHLPGHISLYLPTSKTLIAGDAVVFEEEKLNIANPPFAWDLDEAVRSVQKLLEYDIEHLICYHGGLFHGDINKALNDLLTVYLPLNK
ncbi:putative metallo-hydrolase YflN [compost metagenome]